MQSPLEVLFNRQLDNPCCQRPMRYPPSSSDVPKCSRSPKGARYPSVVAPADPAGDHVRPTVVLQQSSKVWPRFQCPLWYSALAVAVPILFLLPAPVQEQIKTSLLRTPMAAAVFSAADASPHEEDQPSYLRRHKTSLWTNDGFLRCPDGVVLPNVRRSSQGSKLPLTSFHSSIAIAMQAKSSALAAAAVTVLSLF